MSRLSLKETFRTGMICVFILNQNHFLVKRPFHGRYRHASVPRHFMSVSPATPLETHLALPNRVLVGEACKTQPPNGLTGLLLRYNFA